MKKEKITLSPLDLIILKIKKIKHAIFCNEPYELLNYFENTDKGKVGAIRCHKCGMEFLILNKKIKI